MAIDTAWFHKQLEARGGSVQELARYMNLVPSAVSRMLKGERKMSADEQDQVSRYLKVDLEEIALRRRGGAGGFGESNQNTYSADEEKKAAAPSSKKWFIEDDIIYKDGKRWMEGRDGKLIELHPGYGCMKGKITIMPGVDLTAPMDWHEEWGEKLYNE